MNKPKQPRWQAAFLRALERLGEVRPAAEDAQIDHSTVYVRRRSNAGFAAAWDEALAAHAARAAQEQAAEIAALRNYRPHPSPLPEGERERAEELVGAGAQLKRAGHDRWSKAKEAAFFDELAATANVKRAAAAVGISANAVYQRRLRDAHFREKWAAVLETGRAAIEMKLVEAANRAFEPDELDIGEVEPRVSVAEAIRIVQLHGSKGERAAIDAAGAASAQQVEEIREGILTKLKRWKERNDRERLEAGWSLDEAHDYMVPPGWVRP